MRDHQACAIGKALSRADVAEQDDRYANLEVEPVGGETGRVAGVEVFGRVSLCMCWVGDFVSGGVAQHNKSVRRLRRRVKKGMSVMAAPRLGFEHRCSSGSTS